MGLSLLIAVVFILRNRKQRAQCALKVLAAALLKALNGASTAILDDLDVAIAHREVLTLNIRLLVGIHSTVLVGGELSAERLELAEHVNVIGFNVLLFILFDDEAEIFYLTFPLLWKHRSLRQSVTLA